MFKNMKIEVNGDLDEIVVELERLGRKYLVVAAVFEGVGTILISQLGVHNEKYHNPVEEITLAELKQMKSVELKET